MIVNGFSPATALNAAMVDCPFFNADETSQTDGTFCYRCRKLTNFLILLQTFEPSAVMAGTALSMMKLAKLTIVCCFLSKNDSLYVTRHH